MYLYRKLTDEKELTFDEGRVTAAGSGGISIFTDREINFPKLLSAAGDLPAYSVGDRVLTVENGGTVYVIGKIL